jgi:hypothetical protein
MSNTLLDYSLPAILGVSIGYAAVSSWWRRRHPARRPVPYLPGRAPGDQPAAVSTAEAIVADAYALYGDLYEPPTLPALPKRLRAGHP